MMESTDLHIDHVPGSGLGHTLAPWLHIITIVGSLAASMVNLWLASHFVTKEELRQELVQIHETHKDESSGMNRRLDDINRLLIDRLPRR